MRGEWRDASARIVGDAGVIARARAALRAKYGWQMTVGNLLSRLAGRLERRAWLEIEVS